MDNQLNLAPDVLDETEHKLQFQVRNLAPVGSVWGTMIQFKDKAKE